MLWSANVDKLFSYLYVHELFQEQYLVDSLYRAKQDMFVQAALFIFT